MSYNTNLTAFVINIVCIGIGILFLLLSLFKYDCDRFKGFIVLLFFCYATELAFLIFSFIMISRSEEVYNNNESAKYVEIVSWIMFIVNMISTMGVLYITMRCKALRILIRPRNPGNYDPTAIKYPSGQMSITYASRPLSTNRKID